MIFDDYRARALSALTELRPAERVDAERVLELVAARDRPQPPSASPPGASDADEGLRRELLGLIERLGRRGSAGIPFASLARALSADLHGAEALRRESLEHCDRALLMLGL